MALLTHIASLSDTRKISKFDKRRRKYAVRIFFA